MRTIRSLLAGDAVDVRAREPARLPHPRNVPVWLAAGGPRTLRMAGAGADGVFIRVGANTQNIRAAVGAVRAGAVDAGRDPDAVKLGLVLHTVLVDDPDRALLIAKSMAAGYYEYSPALFDAPGLGWDGPPIHELQQQVHPDFHHAPDLEQSGRLVNFLPTEAADAFCLRGDTAEVTRQLIAILELGFDFELVVPHPVPNPPAPDAPGSPHYLELFAREVIPAVRDALDD